MSEPLRVVIVDDEPLAREGLRLRLAPARDVRVIAECANGREAVDVLRREPADVVFMDIRMPELDGFAVLSHLERGPLPAIVFVTAYADQALHAFRAGALDYLVKPYDDRTLLESVERARAYVAMVRRAGPSTRSSLSRITVKSGGRVLFLPVDRIDWIESAGDGVRLHAAGSVFDHVSTMRELEEALDPKAFVRVHRTAIVALRCVSGLEPYSDGEYLVVLANGEKLPLSRRLKSRLEAAIANR